MHSIRFRLSAITLSAILISIAAVVLMVLLTVGRESDRNATEKLTLLCENQRQSLDDYFDSIEQSVEMAANIAVDSLDGVALVEGGVAGEYARTHGQTPEQARRNWTRILLRTAPGCRPLSAALPTTPTGW